MKKVFEQIRRFEKMDFTEGQSFKFILPAVEVKKEQPKVTQSNGLEVGKQYRITVKKYMTEKGTPQFDFMIKWNKNIPMPLRIMEGQVIKETRGMTYMKLHGVPERSIYCSCCGRKLTNKVSMLYGIGPECGGHFSINPYSTEEELNEHLDEIKKRINNIEWEGWIVKSSITDYTEVKV